MMLNIYPFTYSLPIIRQTLVNTYNWVLTPAVMINMDVIACSGPEPVTISVVRARALRSALKMHQKKRRQGLQAEFQWFTVWNGIFCCFFCNNNTQRTSVLSSPKRCSRLIRWVSACPCNYHAKAHAIDMEGARSVTNCPYARVMRVIKTQK